MALTFTDWEHYTDDDGNSRTLDWSGSGMVLRPHLEALLQAVDERIDVLGGGTQHKFGTSLGELALFSRRVQFVDSRITYLIGQYVNHTDNGGDWTGQPTTCAPVWTEAAILAALGSGVTRITTCQNGVASAAWALQCREILPLLRWTRRSLDYTNQAEAVTRLANPAGDWDAAEWIGDPSGPNLYGATWSDGSTQQCWRTAFKAVIPDVRVNYRTFRPDLVLYVQPQRQGDAWSDQDSGMSLAEGIWTPVSVATDASLPYTTPYLGKVETAPADYATYGTRGFQIYTWRAVYQWNVTGGFVFQ